MPDMYDKLGDLLNDALNSGEIPQEKKQKDWNEEDISQSDHKSYDSSLFYFKFNQDKENIEKNEKIRVKILKKDEIPEAQVIKMHNYTTYMQFPVYIQNALNTLDIAYPINTEVIKQKYRVLLKANHPDTQSTIQNPDSVKNNTHLTVDQIKEAYKILCDYFMIK